MKNIVFDCERMKYSDTGIYHYCLNLGQQLQQIAEPHLEQVTIYMPGKVQHLFKNDTRSIRQNSSHKFYMPRTGSFQIWHATYQNTNYLPVRNSRIKVVLTIHDLNFIYDEKKPAAKKLKYLRHLQNNINRADAIVCISEFCKSDVLEYCDTGNKPVHVIHNGTNTLIHPTLSPLSYKPSKRFLFSIGVLTRKKNFHSLLPLLRNNDMELLIAGRCDDPVYLNYLLNSAMNLGVEKKLHVLGIISETEKSWYFENCYAFASASVSEGFCLPVTEAMSVGKPLFLSNQTALPEIGGKVAFYFSDFDGNNMQNVFLKGMRQYKTMNMHDAIIERGSTFCWNKAAGKYLDVYRSF
ncbi:MAG: glycosyltransferase family 1 protein [Ferruginibacter sp.]